MACWNEPDSYHISLDMDTYIRRYQQTTKWIELIVTNSSSDFILSIRRNKTDSRRIGRVRTSLLSHIHAYVVELTLVLCILAVDVMF